MNVKSHKTCKKLPQPEHLTRSKQLDSELEECFKQNNLKNKIIILHREIMIPS